MLKNSSNKRLFSAITFVTIFVLGFISGKFYMDSTTTPSVSVREGHDGYTFINPLLFTKTSLDEITSEYKPLKEVIEKYVKNVEDEKKAQNISVYFRNLDSGQWISVNPEEKFNPASMLKVVTLITTMRLAESDPDFLKTKFTISGDDTDYVESQVYYPVKDAIRSGNSYTIETLTNHLIIDSDNVANAALTNVVGQDRLKKTYEDLELTYPDHATDGYTAPEYSHLFRTLYNGTYLSHSLSEKVLQLLSETNFDHGIVAGVPADTIVSHKFGVKKVEYRELHDCGIVYYPKKPYFLCVMTRGEDFSVLEGVIKTISKLTWDEVSKLDKAI